MPPLADMTITEVAGWCTALGAVVGGLITAMVTAVIKYRKSQMEETQYKDQRVDKGYEFLISNLSTRLANVETLYIKSQAEHVDCLKTQEGFRVTTAIQEERINKQEKLIAEQYKELDQLKARISNINGGSAPK